MKFQIYRTYVTPTKLLQNARRLVHFRTEIEVELWISSTTPYILKIWVENVLFVILPVTPVLNNMEKCALEARRSWSYWRKAAENSRPSKVRGFILFYKSKALFVTFILNFWQKGVCSCKRVINVKFNIN